MRSGRFAADRLAPGLVRLRATVSAARRDRVGGDLAPLGSAEGLDDDELAVGQTGLADGGHPGGHEVRGPMTVAPLAQV